MAITKIVQAPISKGFVNSISDSISLQAGDLLLYAIHNRDNHQFAAPTWNGQTLLQAAAVTAYSYLRVYYVLANSTATANLTSTATGFTDTNVAWVSFRSSTNAFTSTPFRDVKTLSYTSGTYTNPSVTLAGLVAGDNVASFLAWSGWNTGFGNVQSTTAVESNLTAEGVVQNSSNQNTPGRTYLSSGTGYTGSTTVGYTKSGAGSPVHGMIAIAVQESSQLINTITDPLVPNSPVSGTCTGYSNGAATLSFSGVSIPVTITGGSFSGTVPMLADGVTWPRLPATGQTVTLTQASNTATASVDISLPTGHQTLRVGDVVGGVVANFAGVVTDNDRMLGYHFLAAANSLTTDDTAYFVTSDNYWVYRNGDVGADTASLPRTDTLYIQDTTTGVVSSHSVTLSEAGVVVEDDTPNSFTFTAVTNANINTNYTSNEVTISGLGAGVAATLTVANGTYSRNGGAFTSAAGVISNGDTLRVRRTSSASYNTAVTASVTVGTYTTTYSITTKVDNDPDNIKFVTLSALSNIETIEGVTGSVPISITGGQYSKNSGAFTSTAGTVVNTDTIQLSAANGATVRVTIGGKTFSWSSKGGGGGFGGSIGIGI